MSASTNLNDKLSVVIGTYHSSVAQFDFDLDSGDCERQWVDASSSRAIKSICFNGFFCCYGGNDELIRLVNATTKKHVGMLFEHEGSITKIENYHNTHLFSSSEDGSIKIWSMGSNNSPKKRKKGQSGWDCLANLKSKNESLANSSNDVSNMKHDIVDFSVHPSGRLLLSIDSNNFMKIWDLVRAKCIVTIIMPKPALSVHWSPNGHTYAIVRDKKVLIYTKEGVLYKVMKSKIDNGETKEENEYSIQGSIIVSFCYVLHDMIAIGDMYGRIIIYDIDSKQALFRLMGHEYNQAPQNMKELDKEIDEIEKDNENDGNDSDDSNDSNDELYNESWEYRENENSKARIRGMKAVSVNGDVHLISADNHGRICIYNINSCLDMIASYNMNQTDTNDEIEDFDVNKNDQSALKSARMDEMDEKLTDNANEDDNDEEMMADELGLFVFAPLLQVDTEARITCLDAGIVGRLNLMYKWKRPAANETQTETENETENKQESTDNIDSIMNAKPSIDSGNVNTNKVENTNADDSDQEQKANNKKKKSKKKKQSNKKGKKSNKMIDLSRFD